MSWDFIDGVGYDLTDNQVVCEIHFSLITEVVTDEYYGRDKEVGVHKFSSVSECHKFIRDNWYLDELPSVTDNFKWVVHFQSNDTYQFGQFRVEFLDCPSGNYEEFSWT